jgi:hypothetical protein
MFLFNRIRRKTLLASQCTYKTNITKEPDTNLRQPTADWFFNATEMSTAINSIINHFQFSHRTKLTSLISDRITAAFENKYHLFVLDQGNEADWKIDG